MAKYASPAIFVQESDGSFSVSFPTLKAAIHKAITYKMPTKWLRMCYAYAYTNGRSHENILKPSNPKNIKQKTQF